MTVFAEARACRQAFGVSTNPPRHQPTLREPILLIFEDRGQPDFIEPPTLAQGRIEQRSIWTPLDDYLHFPGVGAKAPHASTFSTNTQPERASRTSIQGLRLV